MAWLRWGVAAQWTVRQVIMMCSVAIAMQWMAAEAMSNGSAAGMGDGVVTATSGDGNGGVIALGNGSSGAMDGGTMHILSRSTFPAWDQQARDRDNTTISPLRSGRGEAGGVGVGGWTGCRSGRWPAVTPAWS